MILGEGKWPLEWKSRLRKPQPYGARSRLLYSDDSLGMDKNQNRFPSSATLVGRIWGRPTGDGEGGEDGLESS